MHLIHFIAAVPILSMVTLDLLPSVNAAPVMRGPPDCNLPTCEFPSAGFDVSNEGAGSIDRRWTPNHEILGIYRANGRREIGNENENEKRSPEPKYVRGANRRDPEPINRINGRSPKVRGNKRDPKVRGPRSADPINRINGRGVNRPIIGINDHPKSGHKWGGREANPEPFTRAHDRREANPEPFTRAKWGREAKPEPFTRAHDKREAEADPEPYTRGQHKRDEASDLEFLRTDKREADPEPYTRGQHKRDVETQRSDLESFGHEANPHTEVPNFDLDKRNVIPKHIRPYGDSASFQHFRGKYGKRDEVHDRSFWADGLVEVM